MDIRVAAYAIITDVDDRILLAHWNDSGRRGWTLPGGGLEPGEDPKVAARREVREETGYKARIDDLLGIHSRVIPAAHRISPDKTDPLHTLRIVYRATIVGGKLRDEIDGSTDRAEWFPLSKVRKLSRVKLVDIGLKMAKLL